MVLSVWVVPCDTPDNKSNSFVYLLVMLKMDFGENYTFLPLPCKKTFRTPAMVPFDSPMLYIYFIHKDASASRSVELRLSVLWEKIDNVWGKERICWKGTNAENGCSLEDLVLCCTVWLGFCLLCRGTTEERFWKDFITNLKLRTGRILCWLLFSFCRGQNDQQLSSVPWNDAPCSSLELYFYDIFILLKVDRVFLLDLVAHAPEPIT